MMENWLYTRITRGWARSSWPLWPRLGLILSVGTPRLDGAMSWQDVFGLRRLHGFWWLLLLVELASTSLVKGEIAQTSFSWSSSGVLATSHRHGEDCIVSIKLTL